MGTVYRAHDSALNRDVALELMSNTDLGTEGRARLLNEARTVAQLDHLNIVAVFVAEEFESKPYLVMQLIEGGTLYDQKPENLAQSERRAGPRSLLLSPRTVGSAVQLATDFPHLGLVAENSPLHSSE